MKYKSISFSGHSMLQMFKREITEADVEQVLKKGKIINEYPEDKPYPSFLLLATINKRALHVVASKDENGVCYIITAYEPDSKLWNNDFTKKKK